MKRGKKGKGRELTLHLIHMNNAKHTHIWTVKISSKRRVELTFRDTCNSLSLSLFATLTFLHLKLVLQVKLNTFYSCECLSPSNDP